jgi:Ca2+-binding RTX toxin-like protein
MSTVFRVILEGSQEVPPNDSTASGFGTVVFDSEAVAANYSFDVEGLDFGPITSGLPPTDPNDVTNTHFHNADRGVIGPVVFGQFVPAHDNDDLEVVLNADGTWSESGRWETTDPAPITPFAGVLGSADVGEDVPLYFNVHSVQFPGGEIRGQLVAIADDIDDVEIGTTGNDAIDGLNGNDAIQGLAGNDILDGGDGNDVLDGGGGDDTLTGGKDNDILYGSFGNDTLAGGNGEDSLDGGAGDDVVDGGNSRDELLGGSGDDTLTGGNAEDRLEGGAGNDDLAGDDDNDTLDGGAGNDTLDGGAGRDRASYESATAGVTVRLSVTGPQGTGGAGVDTLVDIEDLVGSRFDDLLIGNDLANILTGGAGDDTLTGGAGDDTLNGGAGNDTLNGLLGDDTLHGGTDDDTLRGGLGSDTLEGGAGDDTLNGGAGRDTASYESATDDVTVRLSVAGPQGTGGAGVDTLVDIENLLGSAFDDLLIGNDRANVLTGAAGDDTLRGGLGDDTLEGGAGNDTLNGGGGQDSYLFNSPLDATSNVDLVAGFNVADDEILLSQSVFTAAGAPGTLAASAFFVGAAAAAADDRIIYNSGTGALLYDADGNGGAAATQFATLATGLALTNNNFQIV